MNYLLFQFFNGSLTEGHSKCIESVKLYSKGICDYVMSNNIKIHGPGIHFEKLQFLEYLEFYDRILYLDTDILVAPNAKNIFSLYSDINCLYAYDENEGNGWMDRDFFIKELTPKINWPKNIKGKYKYYNSGVLLMSKKSMNLYKPFSHIYECKGPHINSFAEQTYFNYSITKSGIKTESIDYRFNRMDLGNYDFLDKRLEADFLHYAGPCKYGTGNKTETMVSDYSKLYNKK